MTSFLHFEVLSFESQSDFDQLHAALTAELQPVGTVESLLVREMAVSQWRMKRWARFETAALNTHKSVEHAALSFHPGVTLGDSLRNIHRAESAARTSFAKAAKELRALRTAKSAKTNPGTADASHLQCKCDGPRHTTQ